MIVHTQLSWCDWLWRPRLLLLIAVRMLTRRNTDAAIQHLDVCTKTYHHQTWKITHLDYLYQTHTEHRHYLVLERLMLVVFFFFTCDFCMQVLALSLPSSCNQNSYILAKQNQKPASAGFLGPMPMLILGGKKVLIHTEYLYNVHFFALIPQML